jgi:4-amino-4-deoxychorismate lyase
VPPSRLGGQWGPWASYRGDGLFETVGAEDGYPFLLEAHLARLASSARALYRQSPRLPMPRDVARLLERAGLARGAAVVRLLWYPGMEVVLGWAERARVPRKAREEGVELELATFASHPFSDHKLTGYGPRLLWQQKARQAGAWGCLFVEPTGEVLEAATANVLFCFGNTVVTPPAPPALPGTVRAYCLAKLAAAGVETVVRPVRLSELQEASGAVLSASVSGLIPVRRIGSVRYARPTWLLEALLAGGFPAPGYRRRSTSTRATPRASNTTS